jgi:hypothetical protein
MLRYALSLLLLHSVSALAVDRYIPKTNSLHVDELIVNHKKYKNAVLKLDSLRFKNKGTVERLPQPPAGTASGDVPVTIVNNQSTSIFVSFTLGDVNQSPGDINWGDGCINPGKTGNASYTTIPKNGSCNATVSPTLDANNNPINSRFCASLTSAPSNCMDAQYTNLTMIETIFAVYNPPYVCSNKLNCVFYDISVIPQYCTDALWKSNQCAGTGGAAYNLPVQLSCSGQPTYTCQGPVSDEYGSENYPSSCGDPSCATVAGGCGSYKIPAYFYPMFVPPENAYQPGAYCLNGNALTITFLAGQ